MQRVSDMWHSYIGAMAITVVNSFFDSRDVAQFFKTNESCQEFAEKSLKMMNFLYADTKASDPKVLPI
jgi:hypothetical protein